MMVLKWWIGTKELYITNNWLIQQDSGPIIFYTDTGSDASLLGWFRPR